jgi:hypothetical protein
MINHEGVLDILGEGINERQVLGNDGKEVHDS